MLWPHAFPLVTGLGSTRSVAVRTALFAGFSATMPVSDSIRAVPHQLTASRLPDAVPALARDSPKTSQVPVYDVRTCMSS